uniref:Titin n=1 Tax=Myripristis murdjan TaxID=586833 RepID=A0A668A5M4_9TELE
MEYEYRVYAENIVGIGKVSKVSEGHIARDPCDPPGTPEATKITKDSVTIVWTKPEYDGGAKVTGYVVEKKELPEGRWLKANFTNVIETEYVATGLVENQQYEFRVIARNAAGVFSGPSYSTGPITAKDEIEPPRISIDPEYTQTIVINAGDSFKIDADVHGKPLPSIHWMKGEQELGNTIHREIKNTSTQACITVKEAKLVDGGQYTLLLKNPGGEKAVQINVVVLDKPGEPQGPLVTAQVEVTSSYTSLVIDKMSRHDSGKYTVTAENSSGTKSAFVVVRVLDTPSAPVNLKVTEVTNHSVTLAWEAPQLDGGSKIKNYIVEKRESTRKTYAAVVTNCHALSWKIEPLQEVDGGLYTLQLTNVAGTETVPFKVVDLTIEVPVRGRPKPVVSWKKDGLPLKQTSSVTILNNATSSKIIIKEATREHVGKYEITLANTAGTVTADIGVVVLDKPGPPKGIKVDAVTSDSITLSWSPPDYDGGCSISNYIVEKRDTNTQEWQMAASNVARTAFKAGRLTHGAEYQFRIYAVNRYGKSTYLDSPGITAQYNFKQPGPPSTPIVKLATKSYMVVTWNEPVNDGGSAVLGYHLERKERTSILWTKMNRGMIKDTEYKVNNIEEGMMYEYRVYAENIAGIGKCSKACEAVAARDPCDPPGTPVVTAVTRTSVSL